MENTPYIRWTADGLEWSVDKKKFPALIEAVAGRQLPSTDLQSKPGTPKS
jgi:hypothetical protein